MFTTGNPVISYFTCTVDKTPHGTVIAPFSVQFLQFFFWYSGGVPVTKFFYCYWWFALAMPANFNCLWSVAIFSTASEAFAPCQQKVTKKASKSFSLRNSPMKQWKEPFFTVLIYSLYGHPRNFKFKRKYQQYGLCFQTLSFRFLWLS